jgi:hypothetical protein
MNINQVVFENIYNKERFYVIGRPATKIVDGVVYVKVHKSLTQKEVFIRRDSLRQIVQGNQKSTKYM